MFVRFLIAGLVTCLGLEGPVRCKVDQKRPPRCVWCEGRPEAAPAAVTQAVAPEAPPAPMPEGPDAFAPVIEAEDEIVAVEPAPAPETDTDNAFVEALTATLEQFTADLAASSPVETAPAIEAPAEETPAALPDFESFVPAEPEPASVAVIEEEPVAVVEEDLYPGLAYALNREAEGLEIAAEPPALEPAAEITEEVAITEEAATTEEAAITEPAPLPQDSRSDRLGQAVRLTGQAIHAWLSVLQTPALACEADTTATIINR